MDGETTQPVHFYPGQDVGGGSAGVQQLPSARKQRKVKESYFDTTPTKERRIGLAAASPATKPTLFVAREHPTETQSHSQ